MRLLIGSMLALVLTGCASQPASKPESAPALAATTAAAVAPSPAATTVEQKPASKSYPGYKKGITPDGRTVYCKKMTKTGSRFTDEVCISAAEVEALAAEGEKDRDQFRRMQTQCGSGGCGTGGG